MTPQVSCQEGACMQIIRKGTLEMLRQIYPVGTIVCLDQMEGESQMASGMKGKVLYVDDAGQIQVEWDNGSGLALIPGVDRFHKISKPQKKKNREEPSR